MTLRSPFSPQQLLFLAIACVAAFSSARAQDLIILQDNTQIQGKVLGVSGSTVQVQDARGTVGRPIGQIREVRMATIPAQFDQALKAMSAGQYDQALQALQAIANFRGLPAPWAMQATSMLGDAYIQKGEIDKAEAAYKDFQRLYPAAAAQPGGASDIGLARLAVAKKDFEGAKQKVEPVTTKALAEKSPSLSPTTAATYSQAFLVMGQIKEGEGDFAGALENYLRTVTLFPQDRAAAALAQQKADELRKQHPELFIP